MKKFAFILMAAAAIFASCNKEEGPQNGGGNNNTGGNLTVKADFTISQNPCKVGDEITFTATATGGAEPYTYNWELGSDIKLEGQTVKYTFEKNNAYIVKLTVLDSQGNKAEKRKNLVVNPAEIAEKGDVTLVWAAYTRGYNAVSTPAVADDGSVYAVSGAASTNPGIFYKFDKDGKELWKKELGALVKATPSIDADGTVYLGYGMDNGTATVTAFNPDGSKKWDFTSDKFWAVDPSALKPSVDICLISIPIVVAILSNELDINIAESTKLKSFFGVSTYLNKDGLSLILTMAVLFKGIISMSKSLYLSLMITLALFKSDDPVNLRISSILLVPSSRIFKSCLIASIELAPGSSSIVGNLPL